MEKKQPSSQHKAPSRVRYEKENPNFTVRMPKGWHELLKQILQESGRSRRKFLGVALKKQKAHYEQARNQAKSEGYQQGLKRGKQEGYNEGFTKGKQEGKNLGYQQGFDEGYAKGRYEWSIAVFCYMCNKPVIVVPNSPDHQQVIYHARGCVRHQQCPP